MRKSILTTGENARLVELERIVREGLESFIKVGKALAEIRDSKLYKEKYPTFTAILHVTLQYF